LRQLALPIQEKNVPTLENFVCGRNTEALNALRGLPLRAENEILIYLWGPTGAGKTHLLRALEEQRQALGRDLVRRLDAEEGAPIPPPFPEWLLVDNIEKGSGDVLESLFIRWNEIREVGGALIVTGQSAPTHLALPPELSSRLGWGQVFRLEPLNDEEKRQALKKAADQRQLPLQDDALDYLMTHTVRDLPSLMQSLEDLDDLSLSHQRAITVPLIREWLQARTPEPS
jgi:DnaA family protein